MASSITIEAHRRRFTVKGGPMQPLSVLVADVLGQLKLAEQLRPEDCQLLLRGKALDLSTPLRFANVGRDKLELKTGREQVLGVQNAPQPAPPSAAAAAAPSAPQHAAPAVNAAVQQPPAMAAAPPQAMPGTSTPAPAAAQVPAAAVEPAAAAAPAVAPSSSAVAGAAEPAAAALPPVDAHPSVALFGRRVWVFTRQAEQQAEGAAGGSQADVDDSFYDFTEADLRRAMAGQAAQRAKQEGGHLMTAAMREREERRRAEAYGNVPIRLYLPDGTTVLQTALPATAPLSELLALARAALGPGAAEGAFLFTTPPRTVLKDLSPSLHAAKLVPAAKVHVGVDATKAAAAAGGHAEEQHVRPEVLALAEAPPERSAVMHARLAGQQQQPPAAGAAAGGSAAAAAGAGSSRAAGAAQVQKGVPKWLKLGSK